MEIIVEPVKIHDKIKIQQLVSLTEFMMLQEHISPAAWQIKSSCLKHTKSK